MRILFDHNVPRKLRAFLPDHHVSKANEMNWAELENGDLLRAAEDEGFELMVTCDQNLSYQQNLKGRRLAILVLGTNDWAILKPHTELIVAAIDRSFKGSFELLPIRRPPSIFCS